MSGDGRLAVHRLHVLTMALFVGGQLVLVVQALRGGRRDDMRAVARAVVEPELWGSSAVARWWRPARDLAPSE